MSLFMRLHCAGSEKLSSTDIARIWSTLFGTFHVPFISVSSSVLLEMSRCSEALLADAALVRPFAGVDAHVSGKTSSFGEGLPTGFAGADVRSFSCLYHCEIEIHVCARVFAASPISYRSSRRLGMS